MSTKIVVSFAEQRSYEFNIAAEQIAGLTQEQARSWLFAQFEKLECDPRNPVGKILILDVILDVAKYSGEKLFAEGGDWSRDFARYVAAALRRPIILVDVDNLKVG